jgi:hypothetical protein
LRSTQCQRHLQTQRVCGRRHTTQRFVRHAKRRLASPTSIITQAAASASTTEVTCCNGATLMP